MTRKKILVIGANGFTGRRILDDLSRNLSYQTTGCSLHDDICPHSGDYRFIRTDICNRQAVKKLFQEVQPDVVINTSALSVPRLLRNAPCRSGCRQHYCRGASGRML